MLLYAISVAARGVTELETRLNWARSLLIPVNLIRKSLPSS